MGGRTFIAVVLSVLGAASLVLPLRSLVQRAMIPPVHDGAPEVRVWQAVELGSSPATVAPEGERYQPILSADGRRILFFEQSTQDAGISLRLWESGLGSTEISPRNGRTVLGAGFSANGRRVLWLSKSPMTDAAELMLWEEGARPRVLPGAHFFGQWGISLSGDGSRGVLFPKDPSAKANLTGKEDSLEPVLISLDGGSVRYVRFRMEDLASNIKIENLDLNILSPLKSNKQRSAKQIRARISPSALSDVDFDGRNDVLLGASGGSDFLWRAFSIGVEGAAPVATTSILRSLSWQRGDPFGVPVVGDYNGDGVLDLATFSPSFVPWTTSRGNWDIFFSESSKSLEWGSTLSSVRHLTLDWGRDDICAVPGDYDGDGATDVAIYRRGDAVWDFLFSAGKFNAAKGLARIEGFGEAVPWGAVGDVPVVADFDGNGFSDMTVVRGWRENPPVPLRWYIRFRGPSKRDTQEFVLGTSGDIPLAADLDGDGEADAIAFHRSRVATEPSRWLIRYGSGAVGEVHWSVPNGEPLVADFDADGRDDLAFFTASGEESLHILNSRIAAELIEVTGARPPFVTRLKWGGGRDKPVSILLREHQLGKP